MDYRYLKAFMATCRYKSFSKAAESLNVAQSAISRQIKLLEESIGHELIIRSSKKIILTDKGEEIFLASKSFEKQLEDLLDYERNAPLNIGVLHGLLEFWLVPIVAHYCNEYNKSIFITVEDPAKLKQMMESGDLDFIITTENIQSELVSSLKLFKEELFIISKDEIERKKLHQYPWVIYNEGDVIFKVSKKHSMQLIKVNSITAMVNLVKLGAGVAVVPAHVIKSSDYLKTQKLARPLDGNVYVASLNYKKMPKYLNRFIDLMRI